MKLLLFLLLFQAYSFEGKNQNLIYIISEPENNRVHNIDLTLNELGQVIELIRRSNNDFDRFSAWELIDGEITLAKSDGKKAVTLSCPKCGIERGGVLIVKYLYSGVFMNYRQIELILKKEKDNSWGLYTFKKKGLPTKVKFIRLKSRKFAGILIGIDGISINH